MATPKKTPAPLTFPVRSLDTWADAYQYVLTACREAGIELPLTAKQTPLLWKVRLKDLPVEQFDHLLHSLVDQVEMLRGITPEQRESLRTGYDLGTLTHEVDNYLGATRNRTSRGSDLSELVPAAIEVARWLAARKDCDGAVPKMQSVLDIVMGGGKIVLERLAQGLQHPLGELGQLVEKEHPVMGEADLARMRDAAAADESRLGCGVVRAAERPRGEQTMLGPQEPGHAGRADHQHVQSEIVLHSPHDNDAQQASGSQLHPVVPP